MEARQGRIEAVDVAKGIGIIAVVIGHIPALNHTPAGDLIYSFHMPLFFFVSGLLQGRRKGMSLALVRRLFSMRMVPYISFGLLAIVVPFAIDYLRLRPWESGSLQQAILGFLIGKPTYGLILWFFPCLLVVEVLGAALLRLPQTPLRWLACCLGAGVGLVVSPWNSVIPWSIDIALVALPFWLLGSQLSQHVPSIQRGIERFGWLAGMVFVPGWILLHVTVLSAPTVDMRSGSYGGAHYFYFGAIMGIAAVLLISFLLEHNKTLSLLGRASFVIYPVHVIGLVIPLVLAAAFSPAVNVSSPGFTVFRVLFSLSCGLLVYAITAKIPRLHYFFTGK